MDGVSSNICEGGRDREASRESTSTRCRMSVDRICRRWKTWLACLLVTGRASQPVGGPHPLPIYLFVVDLSLTSRQNTNEIL